MAIILALLYKNIEEQYYTSDGKNLTAVNDTYSDLKISVKCEIIQNKCFYQLLSLRSFTFEENSNLVSIGSQSFYECKNLTAIDLSSCHKLKIIYNSAFSKCINVSYINLPEGLREIQGSVFSGISLITSITIPQSVEILGPSVFSECRKLKTINFVEGSKLKIIDYFFISQTNISSFEIPENVEKLMEGHFLKQK